MKYTVSSIPELEDAITEGATFSDSIYLQDGANLRGADVTEALGYRIAVNAHAVVDSSLPAWFVFEYDCSLTIHWDVECSVTFARPFSGVTAVVRLVGWPDTPKTEAIIGKLESYGVTVSACADTAAADHGRTSRSVVQAFSPSHYVWIGEALAINGAPAFSADLQSWDLLDALFPNNPHLWNVGKYLTRFGRKGDASQRVEDLRKAAAYLERAIKAEENRAI